MLTCVEQLVQRFFKGFTHPGRVFYNEASLQHELAYFLRTELPVGWRLHIERPAVWFRSAARGLTKKEIDLTVADANGEQVVAIELKCPRQGQHPEQMFKACQDLEFLEQLVGVGFVGGVFAMHVDDRLFYEGGGRDGVYASFRSGAPICGTVRKPTGKRDLIVSLRGSYVPVWTRSEGAHRYWVQAVPGLAE